MEHAQQLQRLMAAIDKLQAQPPLRVSEIIVDPLYSQWRHQGIYEIREPDDKQIVYVGKTKGACDGVAQRIWDHAHGQSGGSDLVNTLQVTRQTFADYRVRSIPIPDARFRGLAELFGIAFFDPKGNRVE
jgi:hypothetical protein